MAANAYEVYESRAGDADRRELIYVVTGTADDSQVLSTVGSTAPASHDGLPKRTTAPIEIEPVHIDENDPDECIWRATVYYEDPSRQRRVRETGDTVNSFQIAGGQFKLYEAIKHIKSYAAGGGEITADIHKGAINVVRKDGKPEVQGVDLPELGGAQIVTLIRYVADTDFTDTYRRTVSHLVYHVNDAGFIIVGVAEYAAGEVLFLGIDADQRGSGDDWETRYRFAIRPNISDACANWAADRKPTVAVPKKGWEYLWVEYEPKKDTKSLIAFPKTINVEQVFYTADLTQLNP